MTDALLNLVRTVAPTIATALGGPLAGVATRALSDALLGKPDGTEEELAHAAATATPEQLLALKQAEYQFAVEMRKLDIDLERISSADRDSARQREVKLRDWTPRLLAASVTIGFFSVLGYMISYGLPQHGGEAMLVMLGTLGTAWGAIISYYFGSSAGSREKNDTLSQVLKVQR
jgi:hypothetical protein